MSKITLSNVGSLIDATTAQTTINRNFSTIQTAMDNTLSRDGTTPDTMGSTLDMNSNAIINLPAPATGGSPARLQDLSTLNGGGTVTNIPVGGTTNQVLVKTSNSDFAVGWSSEAAEITAGTNIAVTGGSPATISTVTTPTFTTVNKVTVTSPATSATLTIPDGVVLTGPAVSGTAMTLGNTETVTGVKTFGSAGAVGRLKLAGTTSGTTIVDASATASGTLTLPAVTDTLVGKATTDTLTNKTLSFPSLTNPVITGASPNTTGQLGFTAGLLNWFDGGGIRSAVASDTTQTLTGKTYDTAGAGNSFSINGVAVTANTGTGSVVRATTPTISQPNLIGTTTTDNAAAGSIGEYVESVILTGSKVALTSTTPKTITSISLTAGDWDVDIMGYILPAATTATTLATASISGTTNVLDTTAGKFQSFQLTSGTFIAGNEIGLSIPPYRLSLSGTTTVFFVARSDFTTSTSAAYGIIRARRVR